MKTEFVYVSPKNSNANDIFVYDMDRLHSCKLLLRRDGMMKLSSISGRYIFWMNENNEDKNWKTLNK
jgi:protease II